MNPVNAILIWCLISAVVMSIVWVCAFHVLGCHNDVFGGDFEDAVPLDETMISVQPQNQITMQNQNTIKNATVLYSQASNTDANDVEMGIQGQPNVMPVAYIVPLIAVAQ